MARENFFRARRGSRTLAGNVKDKVFFGCFHVHTVSMAWGVYQLLAHALALLVLMFFACRLHKAQHSYIQQQRLLQDLPSASDSNGNMIEMSSSYLLIQQSNDSFLELVVTSDNNQPQLLDSASITINGVPLGAGSSGGSSRYAGFANSDSVPTDVLGNSGIDDSSASLAASWGHLQLTEGKITTRELRLGFFATLMALLTVGMFLYGIIARKSIWMIPHFALQVLDVIIGSLTLVGIVFYAPRVDRFFHLHYAALRHSWGPAYDGSDIDSESKAITAERILLAFLICSMLLLLVLKSYVLVAIWRCMRYFYAVQAPHMDMPRNANGYAELGVEPSSQPFDAYGDKAGMYGNTTTAKKTSLPRYESAVTAEFAGVPPPPYEEKQKLSQ